MCTQKSQTSVPCSMEVGQGAAKAKWQAQGSNARDWHSRLTEVGGPSSYLPHRKENWFVEEASPPLAEYRNEGLENAQGQTLEGQTHRSTLTGMGPPSSLCWASHNWLEPPTLLAAPTKLNFVSAIFLVYAAFLRLFQSHSGPIL